MTTKEKEISGIKFSVVPFQVVEALRLKPFLLSKLGPAFGLALGVLKDGLPESGQIGDIKIDGPAISSAIEKLVEQLDETSFIDLIKRLFKNVTAYVQKDGQALQIQFTDLNFDNAMNIVFEGKLFSVYPVMALVLEANFPDFLGLMGQGIGSKIKKIITSEPAEKASTSEQKK